MTGAARPYPLTPKMQRFVEEAAANSLPVLLEGETGTGKSRLAELIHQCSGRPRERFVDADCGGFPRDLLESELFGYEKGAFTGAVSSKAGLVEAANSGTLLLDDVDVLPIHLQVKLLELADSQRVRRVGAALARKFNVRMIATTNKNLLQAVEDGAFRRDLYFRLAVMQFKLPPLRRRKGDLLALVEFKMSELWFNEFPALHGPVPGIEPAAMEVLRNYEWPGNIRELASVLGRALSVTHGGTIQAGHVMGALSNGGADFGTSRANGSRSRRQRYTAPASDSDERQQIEAALRATDGNRAAAARLLGMSRTTLWERIRLYGISPGRGEPLRLGGIPRVSKERVIDCEDS